MYVATLLRDPGSALFADWRPEHFHELIVPALATSVG